MTETIENPYIPPQAELIPANSQLEPDLATRAKLYSPMQIRVGTFLFGPLAGAWFLKANFDSMEKADLSIKSIKWSIAVCILILAIMIVLPERFPRIVLPLAYSYLAGYLAEMYQLKKSAILLSEQFTFQSNWRVTGIGVIALVIFLLIAFGLIFGLAALGILHLA